MNQLIIDGHNLMAIAEPYKSYMQSGDQFAACDALIHDVVSLSNPGFQVTLVFDGGGNVNSKGEPQSRGGITVIYSAHRTSADTVIEELVNRCSARGDYIEVVSGDGGIQSVVMGKNVVRRSPHEFVTEMQSSHADITRVNEDSSRTKKVTLDMRISPEAAELLRRIRDGKNDD